MALRDEYLDTISEETRRLMDVGYYLSDLAKAFRMTGNDRVCEDLTNMAADVFLAQKNINGAVGREINNRLAESQRSVGETLKLVLDVTLTR